MATQLGRKLVKAFLLNDLRGIAIILLGTCVYLILFSTFGHPEISSITLEPTHTFPRKLWQLWKTDAVNFDDDMAYRARSWIKENPTLRYEVLTDLNSLAYVKHTFGPEGFNRPDIVQVYQSLTASIVKADLLRYLIMYAEGGIYADVDVQALVPFEDWIPHRFQEQSLDLIVGIETDEPDFKNHRLLGVKAQSFCQWTFVCKRRAPAMLRLINSIMHWLHDMERVQKQGLGNLIFDFDAVLNVTGPSAFTAAVLAEMSAWAGHAIDWSEFHRLREAKVIERVLVLPAQAFAASTGHSESGSHASMGALVKHHFGASGWSKHHQRFKHPAYGSVEQCNWNPDCVKLWDTNTAAFDALSEQQQLDFLRDILDLEEASRRQKEEKAAKPGTSQDTKPDQGEVESKETKSRDGGVSGESAGTTDSDQNPSLGAADQDVENVGEPTLNDLTSKDENDSEAQPAPDGLADRETKYEIVDADALERMLMQEDYDIPDVATLERTSMSNV